MEERFKEHIGCPRCQGLMVAEPFVDLLKFSNDGESFALRCVQCGEMIDRTILRNRTLPLRRHVKVPSSQEGRPSPDRILSKCIDMKPTIPARYNRRCDDVGHE